MKTTKFVTTFLILTGVLAFHDDAKAQYNVPHHVFGNGGLSVTNSSFRLSGTTGQPGIGIVSSPSHINEAGFWYQTGKILTKIEPILNSLPKEFRLEQNYPNPFNPTTTIQYDLPKSSYVRLIIYNLLGRHIRTLVDAQQQAGRLRATWDGTDEHSLPVATGMYLCRMEAGDFVKVIKLTLVK